MNRDFNTLYSNKLFDRLTSILEDKNVDNNIKIYTALLMVENNLGNADDVYMRLVDQNIMKKDELYHEYSTYDRLYKINPFSKYLFKK